MLLQSAVALQLPLIVQTFVVSLPEVPSTLMASAITDWRMGIRTRVVRTSADVARLTSEIIARRYSLASGSAEYARLAAELLSRNLDESGTKTVGSAVYTEDDYAAARDRRTAMLDAILKLLEIIRGIKGSY